MAVARRWVGLGGATAPLERTDSRRDDDPEARNRAAPRGFIGRLFAPPDGITVSGARVPDGVRVYAVGDVHGRHDLLVRMRTMIAADAAGTDLDRVIVYLGDYVDRGLDSRQTLDLLVDEPMDGFRQVFLRGNHDDTFLRFLDDVSVGAAWLSYGGDATIYSYGVRDDAGAGDRLAHLQAGLRAAVPERHVRFLEGLAPSHEIGDFLFAHAGIHPDRALDEQRDEDLMWIREPFLDADAPFAKVVVHGHTVSDAPDVRDNRIGVDTGAYYSGALSCLVLEGDTKRFLSTADA